MQGDNIVTYVVQDLCNFNKNNLEPFGVPFLVCKDRFYLPDPSAPGFGRRSNLAHIRFLIVSWILIII